MILIKNIEVYNPEPRGKNDILVAGERIIAIGKVIDISSLKKYRHHDYRWFR